MKIAIFTLGCRLNFAESEEMIDKFLKAGHKISFREPNVCLIRGCSLTQKAEKETRQKVREIRKKFKNSFIIATGCLLKNFSLQEADLVLSKKDEDLIFRKINRQSSKIYPTRLRTRSFIKIQDGCQKFCAYCLVPYLRGKEITKSSKEIIDKIKEKERNGYQEIVLTGVNISQWKEGSRSKNFVWLIKEILEKTRIKRIRLSSLWPDKIDERLISLFKDSRLCQHLHLSLQSLSDSVLKRMGRDYQVKDIKKKIKKIKKIFPELSLTADIMVGFPGETEKEFQETFKNLKEIKLSKIHVFRYSARPKTKAALIKNQVEEKIKKKRAKVLLRLSKNLEKNWQKRFLGKIKNVLFEQKRKNFWQGLTDNYLKIFVKSRQNLANQILSVKLKKIYKNGILGCLR